mmetsp:Transcript_5893/g.20732  ORF Transcript_5893/g.20732 Transcript_5893/m.20732 type:complete len:111 (+) Transcript_5893:1990-2322(+)
MGEADGATASHDEALAACAEEHLALVRCYRGSQPQRCHEAHVRFWTCYRTKRVRAWTNQRKEKTCARRKRMVEEDVDVMATQGWNDTHVARWTRWFGDAKKKKEDEDPST